MCQYVVWRNGNKPVILVGKDVFWIQRNIENIESKNRSEMGDHVEGEGLEAATR